MTQARTDERGAITVIAVFLAIFAIAILYTVVGTAEVILARERLQDAADVAALSSAVMHARSMNLLVLINLVMAALLAVLVTIKLVESLAIIGIAIAGALAWPTAGATLAAIPPLQSVQQTMHSTYGDVKDPVYQALEALHDVSGVVAKVTPTAAAVMASGELARFGKPPVVGGVAVGTRMTLPVSDGLFDDLCRKAGGMPVMLARTGLESAGIPALPQLMGVLQSPMESLAGEFSDYFCGESDGSGDKSSGGPSHRQKLQRSYPQIETEASRACAAGEGLQGVGGPPRQVTNPACDQSLAEEEAGKADAQTGGCPQGRDCSLDGPYETRVQAAREQCDPLVAPRPFAYWYQTRKGVVSYQWTGVFWKRGEPSYARPERRGGDPSRDPGEFAPPCGPKDVGPSVAVGYRRRAHLSLARDINPVCSTEEMPEVPTLLPARGTGIEVSLTEVTNILGCRREVEEDIPIETGDSADRDGSNGKAPKVLESGVELGDENFQIRALVQGEAAGREASSIVRLALWDAEDTKNPVGKLGRFGSFSVAGAEYFYDGDHGDEHDRTAWMWNMKWRARLRRFALPESDAGNVLRKACDVALAPSACSSIFELGDARRSLFLH